MKNSIKKFGLLLTVLLMGILFSVSVSALDTTGQCGDNAYWIFDESTSELTISGEGEMWDFEYYDKNRPWEAFISTIKL